MTTVLVSDVVRECEIEEEWLKTEFKPEHAVGIAKHHDVKGEDWKDWAELLSIGKAPQSGNRLETLLEKWGEQQLGSKKTFQFLVETFLNGGNTMVAEIVCKYLKGVIESKNRHQSDVPKRAVTKTCCSKCNSLQTSFLDKLQEELNVFNGSTRESEQAVSCYIEKSIKAGLSTDHLLEHLQSLYDREKLISSSSLLEKFKQLALHEGHQLLRQSMTVSPPPSPTNARSVVSAVALSMQDLHNTSVCCFALFKKQDFRGLHIFKNVSLSLSHSCKYLVAVSDGVTYIAFQSDPELTVWPEKYKSFDCGIAQQSKEFPLSYILELLNKKTRVVLTGFLLGGLLACSITTLIWKCEVFSASCLQERLSCITFSQPFINLPSLTELADSHPEIIGTLHSVYLADDMYPRVLQCLNVPLGTVIGSVSHGSHSPLPFEDPVTQQMFNNLNDDNALWAHLLEQINDLPLFNHYLLTTHLIMPESLELFRLGSTEFNRWLRVEDSKIWSTMKWSTEESMQHYAEIVSLVCRSAAIQPVQAYWTESTSPALLEPLINKVELFYFGPEFIITVEGANLHFCNKLSVGDTEVRNVCSLSGSAFQIDVGDKSNSWQWLQQESVMLYNSFSGRNTIDFLTKVQDIPMSVRQEQLSRCSPAKVIELSYLSALLEQPSHQLLEAFSVKADNIRKFLEKIVEVVPIESIEYASNCGNSSVVDMYREVIQASDLQSLVSTQQVSTGIVCDLGLNSLYPITSSSNSFRSPIDTLKVGREKLTYLNKNKSRHGNTEMLETVNQIRKTDLALCISLIVSFMNQQSIVIPLLEPGTSHVSREGLCVNTSMLAGLGLEEVCSMLKDRNMKQMHVQLKMNFERGERTTNQDERSYAEKLYFLLQCLSKNVIISKKYECYSLEQQLVLVCQSSHITESVSLSDLVRQWEEHFGATILSLVAKPYRPLIARWLKWSLMVNNLREELAKYTAVGVVGLVNSGKSKLVESLFQIVTNSGTIEEKRTAVPFMYNLEGQVDGLDVVDFPGVDDIDESISGLADLVLTLTQITIFVVDYRKVLTESCKKWLERLQVEKVTTLVCLTFADQLYAELAYMKSGHKLEELLDIELNSIRHKLNLPDEWKICFCSFNQDADSVLNSEEGRQILRDVGICSSSEIGDWLVDTLSDDDMAQRIRNFFQGTEPPLSVWMSRAGDQQLSRSDRSHDLPYQLYNASRYGRDKEVLDLLRKGANPDDGYYPLHWASRFYPRIAVTLIQWGADLQRRDIGGYGWIPLHCACASDNMACVKVLLEYHSPTDMMDKKGRTPVDLARQYKHSEVADYITNYKPLARGLLSRYPSIKQLSEFQVSNWYELGLHFHVPKDQIEGIKSSQHPTTQIFLAAKIKNMELRWRDVIEGLQKIDEDRRWMDTALSLSIRHGYRDLLMYLVDTRGVTPTATIKGSDVCTLCSMGYLDVAKYLHEKKIFDVNDSLLHAAKCDHLLEANFLLTECNADPNVTDGEGNTPLALANSPEITILLLKHGAKAENVYKTHSKQIGKLSSERPLEIPLPILITGDGGVGKSTFLKSMLSSKGFLANFSKAKPVTGVDEKTVGIIPYEVVTKEFGRVTCHDFSGQHEFYASHCAILENSLQISPPIILYLADLREEDEQKTVDSLARWMTLVQNQCTKLRDKAHVIVVGSHADQLREKQHNPRSKEKIFAPVLKKFPNFEFIAFIPMDCRYPDTEQMKHAKKLIQKSSAILRSPETISLNAHTFYIYLLDSFKDDLALPLKDVQDRIHKDLDQEAKSKRKKNLLSFIPSTLSGLVEICQQLSKRNLILYLHNEDSPERSFIICDCTTLLSNVTGTVFAPENFRQHCKLASSTGVVPLSRFSEQFKAYDIEMLIAFMSHLELCFEIEDKEVLECVREQEVNPELDSRYLFFPGLIRIETPEKVWEDDFALSCHFGWIIECVQDIQFFDPRCLQVLILRLVFTFGLAPARKVQEHIPSLQRSCSIWKNGIFWCNDEGISSHLELTNNGKSFVLKMRSREFKPEFLAVRSEIIVKVLKTIEEFCPNITTVESVINPQEMIKHPVKPAASLTLFSISNVALAVALNKDDVQSEHQCLTLSQILQFEPYASLDQDILQCICGEINSWKDDRVSDRFINHFAIQVADSEHISMYLAILCNDQSPCTRASARSVSPKQELVHALETWRDTTDGTYSCLRVTLNKYSIFTGRNPLDLAGVAHSDRDPSLIFPEAPSENFGQREGLKAIRTSSSTKLDMLCTRYGLTSNDIDQEVSDEHIIEIYGQMSHRIMVAHHLGLSGVDIESIEYRVGRDMKLMNIYILQEWKRKRFLNETANYRVLLEALLNSGNERTVLKVCKLLGHQ